MRMAPGVGVSPDANEIDSEQTETMLIATKARLKCRLVFLIMMTDKLDRLF